MGRDCTRGVIAFTPGRGFTVPNPAQQAIQFCHTTPQRRDLSG